MVALPAWASCRPRSRKSAPGSPKEQFIEGLALVNTLPGPAGIQLGIFLGYTRAGWWGGVLAGLCFILPAFCILLSLTLIYHHYGALPRIRQLFYGLSPVVVGIFAMSVYRLGRAAVRDMKQVLLAVASRSGRWPHTRGHRPHLAPGRCRRGRAVWLAHLGYPLRAGDPGALRCPSLGERVVDTACLHWHRDRPPRGVHSALAYGILGSFS